MSEFLFQMPAENAYLQQLERDSLIASTELLLHLEGADDEYLEDVFAALEEKNCIPDVSDLIVSASGGEIGIRLEMEKKLAAEGLRPEQLEETDSLRLYLEELAAIPICGDIRKIAGELTGKNADALREQLVNLSLSKVVEMAAQYAGKGVLLLDLIQEGSIGLWQAVQEYSGDGMDFESYRDQKIAFYMAKAVVCQAHASGVGQKMRAAAQDYKMVDERLLAELGRNPTLEEIAEGLHLTPEETAAVAETVKNVRMLNRSVQTQEQPLPEEEDQAIENTAYFQMRQRIEELLSALSSEDAKLLTLRYGLEGGIALTPQQTAARLGITADEVNAREAAALSKLRQNS